MLASFLEHWGYLAVAVGTMLEGEGTLLAAGALAHKGLLGALGVWLAAFLGTTAADELWFAAGRRYGSHVVDKHPELAQRSRQLAKFMTRYGALFVLSLRFLFGLRIVSLLWLGSSGYSYRGFVVLDTLGAAIWAAVIGALGWGAGATLVQLLGRPGREEELLGGALLVAVLGLVLKRASKRRASRARALA